MARPVRPVAGARAGPGLAAVQEAVWQGVVELGHGAVQAVQRDGWQQQQRGSGRGGGEEQEKQRSRADRTEGHRRSALEARQKFSITARAQ